VLAAPDVCEICAWTWPGMAPLLLICANIRMNILRPKLASFRIDLDLQIVTHKIPTVRSTFSPWPLMIAFLLCGTAKAENHKASLTI